MSNYNTMKYRAQEWFLNYDQEKMIQKFQLQTDEVYLYLPVFSIPHRIRRADGFVEVQTSDGSWTEASVNAAMTIYDVLGDSAPDCQAAGSFTTLESLNRVMAGTQKQQLGDGYFDRNARIIDKNGDLVEARCQSLGGRRQTKPGDISYVLDVFPFLSMWFQFWYSDDEFPCQIKYLWDKNATNFLHFETLWYADGYLMDLLLEGLKA